MSGAVILCFSFFNSALVADIEAGTAQNTFGLVNFIGNTHIDTAFRAQKGTASAGNTPVGNEIILLVIHGKYLRIFLYHITSEAPVQ